MGRRKEWKEREEGKEGEEGEEEEKEGGGGRGGTVGSDVFSMAMFSFVSGEHDEAGRGEMETKVCRYVPSCTCTCTCVHVYIPVAVDVEMLYIYRLVHVLIVYSDCRNNHLCCE